MAEKKLMVVVGANTADFMKKMNETANSFKKASEMSRQQTAILNKENQLWKLNNNAATDSLKALAKQAQTNVDKQAVLSNAIRKGKDEYDKVVTAQGATSKAAMTLKDKTLSLEIQQAKLNKTLTESKTRLELIGESAKRVGDKLSSYGRSMSMYVTAPLLAAGGASVKMAMNAVESENLFTVSMGNMASSARAWSENLRKDLGLNSYEVRKNVAMLNTMLGSMKMGEQRSYEMAKGLTQLSYDMASFYDLRPDEAFEKLRAGITGEAEPLKQLGIIVMDSTVKTYAYTNGIAAQGAALTEQQKILARYGVIMEATSKAQGDLARTAESPQNQMRRLQQEVQTLSIDIGIKLIPTVVQIMTKIQEWADRYNSLSEANKDAILKIAGLTAVLGPLALGTAKALEITALFTRAIKWLGPTAIVSGAQVGAGFTAMLGPIGLVVGAIGGLLLLLDAVDAKGTPVARLPKGVREAQKKNASSMSGNQYYSRWEDENSNVLVPAESGLDWNSLLGIGTGGSSGGGGKKKTAAEVIMENLGKATERAAVIADIARTKFENLKLKLGENASQSETLRYQYQSLVTQMNTQTDAIAATELALQKMTSAKSVTSIETLNLVKTLEEERNKYLQVKAAIDEVNAAMKKQLDYASGLSSKNKNKVYDAALAMAFDSAAGGHYDYSKGYGDKAVWVSGTGNIKVNNGVPQFGSGGTVPGAIGSPQLIMAHGGETVLPTHKRGFGGGFVVNGPLVSVNQVSSDYDVERMGEQLVRVLRRKGVLVGV